MSATANRFGWSDERKEALSASEQRSRQVLRLIDNELGSNAPAPKAKRGLFAPATTSSASAANTDTEAADATPAEAAEENDAVHATVLQARKRAAQRSSARRRAEAKARADEERQKAAVETGRWAQRDARMARFATEFEERHGVPIRPRAARVSDAASPAARVSAIPAPHPPSVDKMVDVDASRAYVAELQQQQDQQTSPQRWQSGLSEAPPSRDGESAHMAEERRRMKAGAASPSPGFASPLKAGPAARRRVPGASPALVPPTPTSADRASLEAFLLDSDDDGGSGSDGEGHDDGKVRASSPLAGVQSPRAPSVHDAESDGDDDGEAVVSPAKALEAWAKEAEAPPPSSPAVGSCRAALDKAVASPADTLESADFDEPAASSPAKRVAARLGKAGMAAVLVAAAAVAFDVLARKAGAQ